MLISIFLRISVPYFELLVSLTGLCLDVNQLDFAINGLLSLNMVVTLLVAFVLDNTVPGSRQERGVYIWSSPEDITMDPSSFSDYSLPKKVARFFHCAKCLS